MSSSWEEDARIVGAFIKGGSFDIGHRITRHVGTGEVTMREFAEAAGLAENTIAKYYAAYLWAAKDGVVPAVAELSPDSEYDFGGLTQEAWAGYYRTAMVNPPPWNPGGRPLEPRTGADRHVAKSQAAPTLEQIEAAIVADKEFAKAARRALDKRLAQIAEKAREDAVERGVPVEVAYAEEPAGDQLAGTRIGALIDAGLDAQERYERIAAVREKAREAAEEMAALVEEYSQVGDAEDVELVREIVHFASELAFSAEAFVFEEAQK